ncbi:oxygen-independent coproporphyrinogen III oxidase [Magnetospira thiophila]
MKAADRFKPVDVALIEKYGATGFMYTEYPHKSQWRSDFGAEGLKEALRHLKATTPDAPVLLYVHTPHCEQLCWFCTCHVVVSKKYERIPDYLIYLKKEIGLLRDFFAAEGWTPNVRELHLGGGSPTYLSAEDFQGLLDELRTVWDLSALDEFAMEIDPRHVDVDRMHFYADQGISRISFGIQDFDPQVQEAVNRPQPAEMVARLLPPEVRARFTSVNFDILCGLPYQTPETLRQTMARVAEIGPDRVCFNYMHYVPDKAKHQAMMPAEVIPDFNSRKEIFVAGMEVLLDAGYLRLGYDHFGKPEDAVAQAQAEGRMAWNSFGYTPGRCVDLLGLGVHSYSRLGERYYVQNLYEIPAYREAVSAGQLPVYRGIKLTDDDILRRDVIQTLRSYFGLRFADVEARRGIHFKTTFAPELERLQAFAADGLVEISADGLEVTELGKQFTNLICRVFDFYYHDDLTNRDFVRRA